MIAIATRRHLSRRHLLRGVGASLALPMLDAMVPVFAPVAAAAPVRRFGAIYVGMGVNMQTWTQPEPGGLRINPILQPLAAFRDHLVLVAGLDNREALSISDSGQHPRAQASWLTASRAKKTDGPDIHLGVSLDQLIAQEFSRETELGSLELTVEPTDLAGNCGYGFSCAYNNTLAWRTPTTPLPMENNPRNVFERLFGAAVGSTPERRRRQLETNASILDSVLDQVRGLDQRLGTTDRRKLAEYVDAVRDVERRVQKAEAQATREAVFSMPQQASVPASYEEHARLMLDLQVLAFQSDLTRVFTCVLARESSTRPYPEIGVPEGHHPLSHHQNNPEKLSKLTKINAFHARQLAYFLGRLQAATDGDGTLFDQTILLYGSGMSDGNLHAPWNVPTLLIAGRGYGIAGNRYIECDRGTPLANLQLSVLRALDMRAASFGDSTGTITL
jgi:hypothetical protein